MLIEGSKGIIRPVTEVAFIPASVPRCSSGIVLYFLSKVVSSSNETRRISDDTVFVVLEDKAVDGSAVNFGATAT